MLKKTAQKQITTNDLGEMIKDLKAFTKKEISNLKTFTHNEIDDLAGMVKKGFDDTDRQFGEVHKKFDGMDSRLSRIEKGRNFDHEHRIKHLEIDVKHIKDTFAIE